MQIIEFVDVGDVKNALMYFERSLNDETGHVVAKHMPVFMVCGNSVKLNFPNSQYPTADLSAKILHPIVWEVLNDLECASFKVFSLTGDKASVNRKLFHMHQSNSVLL